MRKISLSRSTASNSRECCCSCVTSLRECGQASTFDTKAFTAVLTPRPKWIVCCAGEEAILHPHHPSPLANHRPRIRRPPESSPRLWSARRSTARYVFCFQVPCRLKSWTTLSAAQDRELTATSKTSRCPYENSLRHRRPSEPGGVAQAGAAR